MTLNDINQGKIFHDSPPRVMEIKTKVNKWDLTKKLLHIKGNCKQGEKTTLRMGENNSKWNKWQRINFQNMQAAHTTQCQKNKQPNQNWGKDLNRHFSKDIQMPSKHMNRCSTSLTISPGSSDGKEFACKVGDPGLIPGLENPLEKGMATHSSILA